MGTNTQILNMALSHIGVGKEVASIKTEKSEEAAAGRRFFNIARDVVLRDFHWPFTTVIEVLALIESDPNSEWAYSYKYPVDCLCMRRILSGIRNDDRNTEVTYKLAHNTSGVIIYTDEPTAFVEYTGRSEDPQIYPPDFTMALSYYLASLLAPRLTGGDPFDLKTKAEKMYRIELSKAAANAFNEEKVEDPPDSEFISIRG